MAPKDISKDSMEYIMLILKSSEGFKPNYHEVAREAGINNANNAQKKFKKIVEAAGFNLVNGAIVGDGGVAGGDGDGEASPAASTLVAKTPKTPRVVGKKKGAAVAAVAKSSAKKRKVEEEEEEDGDEEVQESVGGSQSSVRVEVCDE